MSAGSPRRSSTPDREPDHRLRIPTLPNQALIYRLCGDRNPLHSDPEFASRAGFPRPILHGLCTYGTVARAIADELLGGDVAAVAEFSASFAGVVFPRRDPRGRRVGRRRPPAGHRLRRRARGREGPRQCGVHP